MSKATDVKIAIATLESMSPYSQSKQYRLDEVPKKSGELHKNYEIRTWRERCNANGEGNVVIPPMAFFNALVDAAQYSGKQIPGQGKKTWTAKFRSGIMVKDDLVLPVKKADVEGEWFDVPSDGKRGGGSRVPKCFPVIREWTGKAPFYLLDPIITKDVFEEMLTEAGKYIGIGRFRPQRNGYYGRFAVRSIAWETM